MQGVSGSIHLETQLTLRGDALPSKPQIELLPAPLMKELHTAYYYNILLLLDHYYPQLTAG